MSMFKSKTGLGVILAIVLVGGALAVAHWTDWKIVPWGSAKADVAPTMIEATPPRPTLDLTGLPVIGPQ